jgi:hypothetical protein
LKMTHYQESLNNDDSGCRTEGKALWRALAWLGVQSRLSGSLRSWAAESCSPTSQNRIQNTQHQNYSLHRLRYKFLSVFMDDFFQNILNDKESLCILFKLSVDYKNISPRHVNEL